MRPLHTDRPSGPAFEVLKAFPCAHLVVSRTHSALGGTESVALDWTTNVEHADWWVGRLHPFGDDVGSVVPDSFEAYARIFHPVDVDGRRMTWAAIATANGRVAHADMQFEAITTRRGRASGEHYSVGPSVGSLPRDLLEALVELLANSTSTPHACDVAVWDGYAQLGDPRATVTMSWDVGSAASRRSRDDEQMHDRRPGPQWPRVSAPNREYLLARGPLDDIVPFSDHLGGQSPNVWWPDDHAWIVATEIDFAWTYVGADRRTISAVLAHPAMEALETLPGARHTSDGDEINR